MRKYSVVFLVILVSCLPKNEAPKGSFVTPEDGSEYARGDAIEVNIEAKDEDGFVDEVRLYLDGIGIASRATFPYSFTLETTELEVGTHSLGAEISDDEGDATEISIDFVLTIGMPRVETLQPALIADYAVIVGGSIIDDGGGTISKAGVLWSRVPYDIAGKQEVIAEINDGDFLTILTNLESTTYYITAFAENENGRALGEEVSITIPEPELDL